MLSRKAKHLALVVDITVSAEARFFASLRFAQNDKVSYLLGSKILMIDNASVSVSLFGGSFNKSLTEKILY